jgi:hypothetical protein
MDCLSRVAATFRQPPALGAVAEPSGKQDAIPFFAKKGWTRPKENAAKHPFKGADGVVVSSYRLFIPSGLDNRCLETTTPSAPAKERDHFFMAQPPLLREEGDYAAPTLSATGPKAGWQSVAATRLRQSAVVLLILLLIRPPSLDAQVIAAGQTIRVKLHGRVTTKSAQVGDPVTARVADALKDGRGIVIPAGARLLGRVDFVQPKTVNEDGWLRLLFNRFELADGRAVDTLATASFHHDRPRGIGRRVLTVGMFAGIGALIVGKTKRVAGGLGGAIVGVVLTENKNRFGRDLTLRSGRTIDLKLSDDLPAPANRKF